MRIGQKMEEEARDAFRMKWIALQGKLRARKPEESARRIARRTAAELAGAAHAFEEIGRMLERPARPQEHEETDDLLHGAVEETCRPCPRRDRCWGGEQEATRGSLADAMPEVLRRGYAEAAALPEPIASSCLRAEELARALSERLAAARYRKCLRGAMETSRELLAAQYRAFAAILRLQAEDASAVPWFDARAERRLADVFRAQGYPVAATVWRDGRNRVFAELSGAAAERLAAAEERTAGEVSRILARPMCVAEIARAEEPRVLLRSRDRLQIAVEGVAAHAPGERVSGDRTRFLRLRNGNCYLLFSDGMGHGESAREESARVIALLEQTLRGGLPPELALRTVTSAVLLREEGCAFATVDLLEFDPQTGSARLCKCGAAPSYLCRAGEILRLPGAGMPVGTGIFPPGMSVHTLRPGDRLLLLSDGITDGEEDGWLCALLAETLELPAGELAGRVLASAPEGDDRTVIVLSVREAE